MSDVRAWPLIVRMEPLLCSCAGGGTDDGLCSATLAPLGNAATVASLLVFTGITMLQPPHKFENFSVATSTFAQVGGFAQKPFWSSFVKVCQCLGVAQ